MTRIAGAMGAAALALSACAAFTGERPQAVGAGPRIETQRLNPPTMLRAQTSDAGALLAWAPPRSGAAPSFYYLSIEPLDGAMAPIGPIRIAAAGLHTETLQAVQAVGGTTMVRWSVRACNDAPVAALRGAPPGNCSQPASSVIDVGAPATSRVALATFTIAEEQARF